MCPRSGSWVDCIPTIHARHVVADVLVCQLEGHHTPCLRAISEAAFFSAWHLGVEPAFVDCRPGRNQI